jgi:D-inositol-3-phosphate glycosyltransferase
MLKKRIGVIMYQTSKSKGQELVAQRMVRKFNDLGHDAYLITGVYHDGMEVTPSTSLPEDMGYVYIKDSDLSIPLIRVDSYTSKWPPRRIDFRNFINTLEGIVDAFKLDVLITHSTLWNGPGEVAKFVLWRRTMRRFGGYYDPLVFCHMSHFQRPAPERYSLLERGFRVAWNNFTLPKISEAANLILVVTPFEIASLGVTREKCFLFPGGVDEDPFLQYAETDARALFDQIHVDEGTRLVSYLGTLEERKNPLAVVKVAETLRERRDIHFILAGRGTSPYAETVKKTAESLPNVTYLGEIDEEEKIRLIKASYLNILMSRLEALGLAQLEFMYLGVPVITSASGGQSWLVRNRLEGIHVNGPNDIQGAAEAVTRLVDNPDIRDRLSTNAKKRARTLTLPHLIEALDATLTEDLLKESGLDTLPTEVGTTLTELEHVEKSWSSGSQILITTNRRLFFKQGRFSWNVTEIPYSSISSIEHVKRYAWKTLITGAAVSLFLVSDAYTSIKPAFSDALISQIDTLIRSIRLDPIQHLIGAPRTILLLLPLVIAAIVFATKSRSEFVIHGGEPALLHLPTRFKEAIAFIRSAKDQHIQTNMSEAKTREDEAVD